MSNTIAAVKRLNMKKRSKDERLQNRIPAVVYGRGVESQSIAVPQPEFLKMFKTAGYSSLIDLQVENQPSVKVVIKDIHYDPLRMDVTHVDFHQVRMDEEMSASVPLKFVGEAPAVKTGGGTLVKSLDKLTVRCLPSNLPHEIEVNLETLATFEDAITVADLKLPTGVTVEIESGAAVATVARPLTEDELKKLEEGTAADVSAVKTEGEEKRAAEEAKKAEEEAASKE